MGMTTTMASPPKKPTRTAQMKEAQAALARVRQEYDWAQMSNDRLHVTGAAKGYQEAIRTAEQKVKALAPKPRNPDKPVSPKRQAAIDAHVKAYGESPAKTASIKEINRRVSKAVEWSEAFGAKKEAPTPAATRAGPFKAPDPLKVIEKRNETARSHAEVAKATGNSARAEIGRDLVRRNDADLSRLGAPKWTDSRPAGQPMVNPHTGVSVGSTAAPAGPTRMEKAGNIWRKAQTPIAGAATVIAGATAYKQAIDDGKGHGEAAIAGAKAAAVPGAIAASPIIAKGAGHVASGAFAVAGAAFEATGFTDAVFMNFAMAKAGLAAGAVGVAAKGVEFGARAVGKIAAPAAMAYGAYQGAKADDNKTRGSIRGAISALDPTSLVTMWGADKRGLAERGFDKAFGRADAPGTGKWSADKAKQFASREQTYADAHMTGHGAGDGPKGWGAQARINAYQSRMSNMGKSAENAPYGGDPTRAPGYVAPKKERG